MWVITKICNVLYYNGQYYICQKYSIVQENKGVFSNTWETLTLFAWNLITLLFYDVLRISSHL